MIIPPHNRVPSRVPRWANRALLATGALLLLAFAALLVRTLFPPRVGPAPPAPEQTAVDLLEPRPLAGGALALGWKPVPGADAYRVIFLRRDLSEILTTAPLAEPRLALQAGQLPEGLAAGDSVCWQVAAFRDGAEVAASVVAGVRLP